MNSNQKYITRREFLKTAGETVAGAALAMTGLDTLGQLTTVFAANNKKASFDKYDFLMPRVKFSCDRRVRARWNVYPGADRNLLSEFSRVIRCKVKLPTNCNDYRPTHGKEHLFNDVVDLTDLGHMRRYPFLFMTAEGYYTLSKKKIGNLEQYLNEGGFLLMDDCVFNASKSGIGAGDFFYQSSYEILEEIFGTGSVKRIPKQHEVFHNVYDLGDVGLPYLQGQRHGARGIFIGERLAVFLSAHDIHCVWAGWKGKKSTIYKQSIQMGINIIMYTMSH